MSVTSQGPGWWRAADGKWYPPQPPPTPGFAPGPSPYGSPFGPWVQPVATSGLAIASLVLSILWIGGLGSILAVIFGVVALSQIRQSQGRVQGTGLATAGLVIGGIGIIGIVLLVTSAVIAGNNVGKAIKVGPAPTTIPSVTPSTGSPAASATELMLDAQACSALVADQAQGASGRASASAIASFAAATNAAGGNGQAAGLPGQLARDASQFRDAQVSGGYDNMYPTAAVGNDCTQVGVTVYSSTSS